MFARKIKEKSSVPEGVKIVPVSGVGVPRIGEHENGGGKGEAERGEAEDEDEGVEAPELADGDGGVEVRRVFRFRLDSRWPSRRSLNAAVSERPRGPHISVTLTLSSYIENKRL